METNDDILALHIPWETYRATGQIGDRDLALIKRIDKSTNSAKDNILDDCSAGVFHSLFSVLRNVDQTQTVKYTLALFDEIFTLYPDRAPEMHVVSPKHPGADPPNAPQVLVRLLRRNDLFIQNKAAKLLGLALKTHPAPDENLCAQFLGWLTTQLQNSPHGDVSVLMASEALTMLLRSRAMRAKFVDGIPLLESALKNTILSTSPKRSQMLYNLGLCFWQLSFDTDAQEKLKASGAVQPLVELLKEGNKEKVTRIALMTLSRMMEFGGAELLGQMVDAGLPRIVRIRSAQEWSDEDVPDLLKKIEEVLGNTHTVTLSSFEKFRNEILSGELEWSRAHTDLAFWKEHLAAFEEKDFLILRCLVKLLETSEDPKVISIACNDLSMFAEAHSHGRFIINDLGGKAHVMRHMTNTDHDVQKHALLCVQRLMLGRDKLDFLRGMEEKN